MKKQLYVGLITAIVIVIGAIVAIELNAPVLGACLFVAAITTVARIATLVDTLCDEYED